MSLLELTVLRVPSAGGSQSRGRLEPDRLREAPEARSEAELFERYQQGGDLSAREQLVRRFMPLASRLARRYSGGTEPFEDLVQVASFGLVKAIDRFDPDHGARFTSYAVPTMLGELRRHFRDSSWAMHLPRDLQERVLEINAAVERLTGTLGHSPAPAQVAAEVGLDIDAVLEAMQAADAFKTLSLDAPLRLGEEADGTVADALGERDEHLDRAEYRPAMFRALKSLPAREGAIIYLRFVEDLTQSEIGARLGISQMHVSRLLRRALERMREVAGATGGDAAAA